MKDRIKEMYGEVRMPPDCETAVRKALADGGRRQFRFRPIPAIAALAAIILVVLLSCNSAVQAAALEMAEKVGQTIYLWNNPPAADADYYKLEIIEDRIYLYTRYEQIDITGQFSMEEPYIYSYHDGKVCEKIIVIGGTLDNLGYADYERDIETGVWLGGHSHNYWDSANERVYPWVKASWEILDIPFPMPR